MPLSLALVFHFNQHTSEQVRVASRACYRGLLNVLRAHPQLKFNLHLSGTVLRGLPWFDPECMALIKAGVAAGQFEILGSTYSQNVPYACDDWDNAEQIAIHAEQLHTLFNVTPTTFWLSERCWRQSLLPVIVEGGYTTTLIEDHILHRAGITEPTPVSTSVGDQKLTVVYDDTALRERFNYAAWHGRRKQFFDYVRDLAQRPNAENWTLAYAEDAEAMGLWGWGKGYLPQANWFYLDALLTELEATPEVTLIHLNTVQAQKAIGPLPDGSALWMDDALHNPALPYHEDGFTNWFDYVERSPKVARFRSFYDHIRSTLQALGSSHSDPGYPRPAHSATDRLYRQAIEALCHHQYEFGCIGVGGAGYWGWEGARWAFLLGRAAEIAEDPAPRQWIEDVTGDGSDEQLLCDGRQLVVLTARGGRVIAWLDLTEGHHWIGNRLAIPDARYEHGLTCWPAPRLRPQLWLPDTFDTDLKPWKKIKAKEANPTHLGQRLPEWIFKGEPAEVTVYPIQTKGEETRVPQRAQTGAFTDWATLDDASNSAPAMPVDTLLDYRFEKDGVGYLVYPVYASAEVVVDKHLALSGDGLTVRYDIHNRGEQAHRLTLRIANELCPDYDAMLPVGRAAFHFEAGPNTYRVVNTVTNTAVVLEASQPWAALEQLENVLALEVVVTYALPLAPNTSHHLEFSLKIVRL